MLSQFDLEIKYIAGPENLVSDALSRWAYPHHHEDPEGLPHVPINLGSELGHGITKTHEPSN